MLINVHFKLWINEQQPESVIISLDNSEWSSINAGWHYLFSRTDKKCFEHHHYDSKIKGEMSRAQHKITKIFLLWGSKSGLNYGMQKYKLYLCVSNVCKSVLTRRIHIHIHCSILNNRRWCDLIPEISAQIQVFGLYHGGAFWLTCKFCFCKRMGIWHWTPAIYYISVFSEMNSQNKMEIIHHE